MTRTQALRMAKADKARKSKAGGSLIQFVDGPAIPLDRQVAHVRAKDRYMNGAAGEGTRWLMFMK